MRSIVRRECASATAARPVASPARKRSACTAGIAAVPGRSMPSASATHAIVLAVPMTAQVPAVVASRVSTRSIVARSTSLLRNFAQKRRQSVHAPRRSPSCREVSIGPATSAIAGTRADAAPISCAGSVLSQPPTRTTASSGCARHISSTSIAMRLRYMRLVGWRKTSPSEIVGNASGRPPAASTPRLTESISSGKWRWQLLRSDAALAMPMVGCPSSPVE